MNILLDTHAFIWWTCDPEKLPGTLFTRLMDPRNTLLLSTVSSWEIMIKTGIGKLSFNEDLEMVISREIEKNGLQIIPITLDHTYRLKRIPPIHKDPFDRMLIAQALSAGLKIATDDSFIEQYDGVETVWA